MSSNKIAGALIAGVLWAGVAAAAPVQWTIASGGNGHWYESVSAPGTTWTAAKAAAEAAGGYLATITSAAENSFVAAVVPHATNGTPFPYWLGGFQDPNLPEPPTNAGWQWVTGEAWVYDNWATNEPNNASEDSLAFAFFSTGDKWNDAPTGYTGYGTGGYVVEYVPEPASLALVLTGLLGLGFGRRRTRG